MLDEKFEGAPKAGRQMWLIFLLSLLLLLVAWALPRPAGAASPQLSPVANQYSGGYSLETCPAQREPLAQPVEWMTWGLSSYN
jgi:hypothetical protein